jgi:hypothetical protein
MPPHSSAQSSPARINNRSMSMRTRQLLGLAAALLLAVIGYAYSPKVRSVVASMDLGRTGVMIGAGEGQVGAPNVSFAAGMVPFQTCTLGCSATVPATGTAGQAVNFQSSGTPSNCITGPTFQWSFGNGDTSSAQNPSYAYASSGNFNWQLTVSATQSGGGGGGTISTVAGGEGEGTPAGQISFYRLTGLARDPLARGIFLTAERESTNLIYFVNTSASSVTLAGKTFAAGEVRVVAGGGKLFNVENTLGTDLDLTSMRAVAVSPDGSLVYFIENGAVRALNVGTTTATIGGGSLGASNVRTLALTGFGTELCALAVNPSDSAVFAADATAGINKVFRIDPATGNTTVIVGNGAVTTEGAPFVPGQAGQIPLLQPRAIKFNGSALVVADTGHRRVINVNPATAVGSATLIHQFLDDSPSPFINGLAIAGGVPYVIDGNRQTVNLASGSLVAGISGIACTYQSNPSCGDGGQPASATFAFVGGGSLVQEAAMDGDASGIYVVDQSPFSRARVRYINRTALPVTLAGVSIPASTVQTIAGKGLDSPYDGGLSNAAFLSAPIGVAVDANNNLWSTDTLAVNRLRFHNRGASQVAIFPGTASQQIVPAGATVTVNANSGALGDVIPAIQGGFNNPQGLFATSQGIYVADSLGGPTLGGIGGQRTSALRFINTSGVTVTFFAASAAPVAIPPGSMARIAGCDPLLTTCAELGFARTSKFVGMSDVAVGPNGDIYVTAVAESKVRKISSSTGNVTDLSVPFAKYTGIGLSPAGLLYLVDTNGGKLLKETGANTNSFTTLVVSGLSSPRDVAISSTNTAYVTTAGNHRVIQVTDLGATAIFAGSTQGFSGDGGAATSARLNISPPAIDVQVPTGSLQPQTVGIAVSSAGDVFFADTNNNRLRRVGGSGGLVTCVRSGTINISAAPNPLPSISSLSPLSTLAGGATFQLLVNGSNFVGASVVNWNGSPRTTSFVNSGQLQAQINAADIATGGSASITVFNPAPGGGTSNSSAFAINNAAPSLIGISPSSAVAGGIAFTLTAAGNNFVSTSTVQWNGSNRTTTFINSTTLQASINAADIANASTANVTVVTPAPGGGTSGASSFTIAAVGQGFEADVAPRPNGNGTVGLTDYVQIGRFAAGLDAVNVGSEFQKADCAPKDTLGNGSVSLADWVQAGRYAAVIDQPVPAAGGPTGPPPFTSDSLAVTDVVATPDQARILRVNNQTIAKGSSGDVTVEVVSQGDENTFGFSLNFDTSNLTFVSVALPSTIPAGTALLQNTSAVASGRIGLAVSLPFGASLVAGTRQLAVITFAALPAGPASSTQISFGDSPITRELVRADASVIPNSQAQFLAGTITLTGGATNPVPTLSNLNPNSAIAGGAGFNLVVTGTNFVAASVVNFNGSPRATTFNSSTQLTAAILASDIQNVGTPGVTVTSPGPGGGTTAALTFTITASNPVPTITSLNPNSATAGGIAFNLVVTGTNFVATSVVNFNGSPRTTTFNSSTQLTAAILASDIQNVGTPGVTVTSPAPGGGTTAPRTFTITASNPVPTITSLNPNSATAGGVGFNLVVTGTNFVATSVVNFNGSPRTTTFNSSTQLTAAILASDIQNVGTPGVTVTSPAPGGGTTAPQTFTITANNPVPMITTLNPTSATAGGPAFVLTVNGSGFISSTVVRWNGANRTTTFVNATQLTAQIPASDIAAAATPAITVSSPAPGGGVSNSVNFNVTATPTSVVRAVATAITRGQSGVVPVELLSTGLENAVSFTLAFDTTQLSFVSAAGGTGVVGATVNINQSLAGSGLLGVNIAQSPGTAFQTGTRQLITVTFSALQSGQLASTNITFPGSPVASEVSGVFANLLPATFTPAAVTFSQANNPVPSLTSLSINLTTAGSPAFSLLVNGSNFVANSVVQWNGAARTTTLVNSTQLSASISAADVGTQGTAEVTVFNPAPGGGTSNALTFTISAPNNLGPVVTSVVPSSATAGGAQFIAQVNGSNFVSGATVNWNGAARPTSFVSATQLNVTISAADIAAAGTAQITVTNPAPGGGTSGTLAFTVNNPVPTLGSLSPPSTVAGGGAFQISVAGTNFVPDSQVLWNGSIRTTTFISATQITAAISEGDIASQGGATISVLNPAPGGGTSNTATFTISSATSLPVISSLTPNSALAGGAQFSLKVLGSNFQTSSKVQWNGAQRNTTFDGAGQLTAIIPASDIANGGVATVTVVTAGVNGGTSNGVSFTVTGPNPIPSITSLSPNSIAAGSPGFTLTVTGTGFVANSTVTWNGANRPTTFVNATTVTALISGTDIAAQGAATVAVFNPEPGGGASNGVSFTITPGNPVPVITSLSPNQVSAGSGALILTVNGSDFVNGAVVNWNGSPRGTTFVNSGVVTAQITANDVLNGGITTVTVVNPSPGGGVSNALPFTIVGPNPVPVIVSLNPTGALVGSAAFVLNVAGTNFVANSVVNWNGQPRTTTFIGPTQLSAQISAADIANTTTATITVFNPSPGGGTSNAVNFPVGVANPVPTLTSINPSTTSAKGPPFTLNVIGTGFTANSVVQWNGSPRPTVFVNATTLTALVAGADIGFPGTASVTVFNPAPGGGTSNAVSFGITNPVPLVASLSPSSILVGSAGFTLQVIGSNFVDNSVVRWNGQDRVTTFINATQLNAQITAADVAAAASLPVSVFTPTPGGGSSNAVNFSIFAPAGAPTLTSLAPNFTNFGGPALDVILNGTNFVPTSVVQWNGSARVTTFISSTTLKAAIPASDIAVPGSASIRVFSPPPGGGTSLALRFAISRPLANTNAASFVAGSVARESIVAAFGEQLATGTASASTIPLPLSLLGTNVVIKDALGVERVGRLFFVSPQQVNYEIPADTAIGAATVTITSGDGINSIGTVQVVSVAPGVFSANADAQGPGAAHVVRVSASGGQTIESVVRFDAATGKYVSVPIVFGPQSESLYLVFFGTGLRSRTALSAVSVTLGGTPLTVTYAGAAPGFVGLDQLNLGPVPRSFIGRGAVNLSVSVDGKIANTVSVSFQ